MGLGWCVVNSPIVNEAEILVPLPFFTLLFVGFSSALTALGSLHQLEQPGEQSSSSSFGTLNLPLENLQDVCNQRHINC